MKITKYPQSCFMLEAAGKRILVDPGNMSFEDSFLEDWKLADFILLTHKHTDHCHLEALQQMSVPIYSSSEVAAAYPELKINVVKAGDKLRLADGIEVEVASAVHGYNPTLRGEKEIHENIGYIIDLDGKKIYFTSDTICFKNNYKCDILCAPVSAHGLVMSPFEVALLAKQYGTSLVLPCHMDNPSYPVDVAKMQELFRAHGVNFKVLKSGEAIEV